MEIVVSFVMSLLLGMIPEVLYFTLFIIYTKNIKEKRIKLFMLTSLIYVLCIMISRFKILYYVSFIFLIYFILKILYKDKTQVIDVFVFSLSTIYLSFVGYICSRFINNNYLIYYVTLIINRILLFIPFIFRKNFNKLYKIYCGLWNRNDKVKRPIKSITLRNVSLVILNIFIFILNIMTVYVINTFS